MNTEQPDETNASPQDEAASPSPEPKHEEPKPADAAPLHPKSVMPQDVATQPEGLAAPGDDGGDDEGEGEDEPGAGEGGAEAGATENVAGAPGEKKKRRRRRRKKKGGAAGALGATGEGAVARPEGAEGAPAANADGEAPAEGAAAGTPEGERPKRERRDKKRDRPHHHEERERPAFNQGDVVFGKVIEFNEDVIFIDLSGKAKAIFDLRELLITEEDDANTPEEEDESDGEEAKAEGETSPESPESPAEDAGVAETDVGHAALSPELAAAPVDVTVAETPQSKAETEAKAEPVRRIVRPPVREEETKPEETPAEASGTEIEKPAETGESTEAVAAEAAPQEAKPQPAPQPQLPRVILEPGAPFVGVVHNDGGRGGLVVLTHHPKRVRRSKPIVSTAFREKTQVWGIVTGVIKGGVEIDVDGLRAFAPGSHMDLRMGADLHPLIGKRLPFAVTQYGKRGHNVVLSRKSILEETAKEQREEALKNIKIGAVVEGTVRTVVQFGAFIDIGGVEGLVPLSEMSHNRGDTPKDVFKVGEKVEVKILRVDEKGKLWLSRRSAIPDPWSAVSEKYAPGTKHTGKVARLQPFGAFIELEPGVDGLIHTADLSIKRIEHPSEVLKVGDPIDVWVANVDPSHHRIGLHPAPTGDAAGEAPQRVQIHKIVKVAVVAIEPNGLVVRVLGATGRHARGFITAAGTGTPKGAELRKLFPIGKELDAKVTEMDPRRSDIRLSLKAVNEDNERNAYNQYRAQVKREAKFGTFADLLKKVNVPKE